MLGIVLAFRVLYLVTLGSLFNDRIDGIDSGNISKKIGAKLIAPIFVYTKF